MLLTKSTADDGHVKSAVLARDSEYLLMDQVEQANVQVAFYSIVDAFLETPMRLARLTSHWSRFVILMKALRSERQQQQREQQRQQQLQKQLQKRRDKEKQLKKQKKQQRKKKK